MTASRTSARPEQRGLTSVSRLGNRGRSFLLLAMAIGCNDPGTGIGPDFTLAVSPATLALAPGEVSTATVAVDRQDFSEAVSLSVTGAPTGITWRFSPTTTSASSAELVVAAADEVPEGDYSMVVVGKGAGGERERSLTIRVLRPPPSIQLSLDPASLTIDQGTSQETGITISRTSFAGTVALSSSGAPVGVGVSFNVVETTGGSARMTIAVGPNSRPGLPDCDRGERGAGRDRIHLVDAARPCDESQLLHRSMSVSRVTITSSGRAIVQVTIARAPGFADSVAL